MKIGVVTLFKNNYNYGATLQAFALQSYLKSKGHCVDILDIDTLHYPNFNKKDELNSFRKSLNRLVNKFKRLSTLEEVYWFFNKFLYKRKYFEWRKVSSEQRYEFFDKFIFENISVSPKYDNENLYLINDDYDFFITGSDQVWKPQCTCDEYFLEFASNKMLTMSYAASFGVDTLENDEKLYVKEKLNNINFISVRESCGMDILKDLGYENINHVVDPTLLLKFDFWNNIIEEFPLVKEKYVFLYLLSPNLKLIKKLRKQCNQNGLNLVAINGLLDNDLSTLYYCDQLVDGVGPKEFLNLIKNSQYVITDSFHGTVFSIVFKKSFWTVSRNSEGKNMNSRMMSLLEDANASQRFLANLLDLSLTKDLKAEDYINYLSDRINKSKDFLNFVFDKRLNDKFE